MSSPAAGPRPHRFLARTLSAARWSEYAMLLKVAREEGWVAMDLEQWIDAGGPQGRVLILRHDVDQHPATAVRMARIEARNGVRGTWYFRWRTSSAVAIKRVRELGGHVGLHYETLTRLALERKLSGADIDEELIAEARLGLRREVSAFQHRFGAIHSICAHGDTRVPQVSNQALVQGVDAAWFGVAFDAGAALGRHRLGLWMTDRISSEGRWKDGTDPLAVLRESEDPVLCLTHPNNWCSGLSLWSDRLRAAALPRHHRRGNPRGGMRTGGDRPLVVHPGAAPVRPMVPRPELRPAPPVRPFGPISVTLRREILRHYYDAGQPPMTEPGMRTLQTNSALAESRAATLERALAWAEVASLRDRDLLDLGCGFGALALVFAARGARVTALDPNSPRLEVGARVGREHALGVSWIVGGMDSTDLGRERFDVAVMNNSFCYLVDREQRRQALERVRLALRPGGVLVLRNPKRYRLRDQFTGIPLLGLLPPAGARSVSRVAHLRRSDVRLLSGAAARRELERAGFIDVGLVPGSGAGRVIDALGAYQHLVARRPGS